MASRQAYGLWYAQCLCISTIVPTIIVSVSLCTIGKNCRNKPKQQQKSCLLRNYVPLVKAYFIQIRKSLICYNRSLYNTETTLYQIVPPADKGLQTTSLPLFGLLCSKEEGVYVVRRPKPDSYLVAVAFLYSAFMTQKMHWRLLSGIVVYVVVLCSRERQKYKQ